MTEKEQQLYAAVFYIFVMNYSLSINAGCGKID